MKSIFSVFILFVFFICSSAAHDEKPTLPKLVVGAKKFNILVQLLNVTDLLPIVVAAKNITIFAPTDFAFKNTATDLGCKDTSSNAKVMSCLLGLLTINQIKTVLLYHVVQGVYGPLKVLLTPSFKTLSGKSFLSVGLKLIDLSAGIPNPQLVLTMLNLKYDNGVVHSINRALIPFLNLAPPCALIENPIVLSTEDFIPPRLLYLAGRFCPAVQKAVRACKKGKRCFKGKGRRFVAPGINFGRLVAAATSCKSVPMAIKKCT